MNKRVWAALLITLAIIFPISSFSQDSLNVHKAGQLYDFMNSVSDIAIYHDYMYVAPSMFVFDISDPENSSKLGYYPGNWCRKYIIIGNYLYGINEVYYSGYKQIIMKIFDLANPAIPEFIDEFVIEYASNTSFAYDSWVLGNKIVYCSNAGTYKYYDVSNPTDPFEVQINNINEVPVGIGQIGDFEVVAFPDRIECYHNEFTDLLCTYTVENSPLRCIDFYNNYCYWTDSSYDLQVIQFTPPGFVQNIYEDESVSGSKLYIRGNKLFFRQSIDPGGSYVVFEITPSGIPQRIDNYGIEGFKSVAIKDDYIFNVGQTVVYEHGEIVWYRNDLIKILEITPSENIETVDIIYSDRVSGQLDISVSENLAVFYRYTLSSDYDYSGFIDESIVVTDISDPTNAFEITSYYNYSGGGIGLKDHILYIPLSTSFSVKVIDYSNSSSPDTLNSLSREIFGGFIGVYNEYLVFSNSDTISLYEHENPQQVPTFINSFQLPISGYWIPFNEFTMAYYRDEIFIFDISDPLNPVYLSENPYNTDFGIRKVGTFNEYAICLCTPLDDFYSDPHTIRILDFSDPDNPIEINNVYFDKTITDIEVKDDRLYILNSSYGLRIFDLNDPVELTEMGYYQKPPIGNHIAVNDDYAFTIGTSLCAYDCTEALDVESYESEKLPEDFQLLQAYPNPFNPTLNIRVALPETGDLRLSVHNILGQEVAVLADRPINAGYHNFVFDGSDLSSGVYFVKASIAGRMNDVQKVVLMK